MSHRLVFTKLSLPRVRPELVKRPRLTGLVDQEAMHKLTLISAPAGFGKTTLLGEWLGSHTEDKRSVAWLSLDAGDNDPARFLSYLVASLKGVEGGIGEGVLGSLRSPEPPRAEAIAGTLANEIADTGREFTLIFDDYHVIETEPVHELVTFLVEYLPANARVVISSRTRPPLPLARLRARGQMNEVGVRELRFNSEEAAVFLQKTMGLGLEAEDVAVLEERTEGWIAALQLAALSMRDRQDLSGFIESFSGSHRHVLDFLTAEVLDKQPERVRNFLLRTSVLSQLSGELCDAVTGEYGGQEMLERLERDNLFVVALDDERYWYRYHHLFAEFLRSRLQRESPEQIKELHVRGAYWHEEYGSCSEAIHHALLAEDYGRAVGLVERVAQDMWSRGEVLTLRSWMEALPEDEVRIRPPLCLNYAMALLLTGRPDRAEAFVQEAERRVGLLGEDTPQDMDKTRKRYILGGVCAIRGWCARFRGACRHAIELCRQALDLLSEEASLLRSVAAACLGEAYRDIDELPAASAAFVKAVELGRAADNAYMVLMSMVQHAWVQVSRGRLGQAHDTLQRSLRLANEQNATLLPAAASIHLGLGELHYEWNELDCAQRHLQEGSVGLAERIGEIQALVRSRITLSRLKRAQGDEEGALQAAHEAEQTALNSGIEQTIAKATVYKARLHLDRGELSAATALEQRHAVDTEDYGSAAHEPIQITHARLLSARGEHNAALCLLDPLCKEAEKTERISSIIEILNLTALVLRAKGENGRAVDILTRALSLAEPEGYIRTFVDEGPPIAALLSEIFEMRQKERSDPPGCISSHYLIRLLATSTQDITNSADGEFPGLLSEREFEVLKLVEFGLSNQEIAAELFVSLATAKTHLNNLYRKLGARSRTQALSQARALNLL